MGINFAAASTAGLNNPGTEIITLVKDESGNFINPPSYDKMRAYLSSGEVPMLFVTAEAGETGSLYQLVEYSETENKIRFSNSANAIEFCAGCEVPVVSEAGGGGERWRLVRTINLNENVTAIDISEDNDGNPFALRKIRIIGDTLGTGSGGQLRINVANNIDDRYSILGPYSNFKGLETTKRWWVAESECFGIIEGQGKWSEWYNTPDSTSVGAAYARSGLRSPLLNGGQYLQDRVEFLHIFSNTSGVDFAAGSYIELWGVDA